MLNLIDAKILGYRPQNTDGGVAPFDVAQAAADYQIDVDRTTETALDEQAQDRIDTGSLSIDNYDGLYTDSTRDDAPTIGVGDRLSLWVNTTLPDDLKSAFASGGTIQSEYGTARYDESRFGVYDDSSGETPEYIHRWTGLLRTFQNAGTGGLGYDLSIDAGDYVYQTLSNTRYSNTFRGAALAGSVDAILNTALRQELDGRIGRSGLESVGATTDITWRHRTLLDLLKECVLRGDAVSRADDTRLLFRSSDALTPSFTVTHGSGDWYGDVSYQPLTDSLCNRLVVIGGTEPEVDDEQTTHDGRITVTDQPADMATVAIDPRRPRVDSVDVWTDPTVSGGAVQGSGILARIQTDEGGAPVAIDDKKSDLTSGQVDADELTQDGWTRIDIGDDEVAPGVTNWLIIQGTSSTGQSIGVRASDDTPTFQTRYPFPVAVEPASFDSQSEYGRWDDAVSDETLRTSQAARDYGQSRIDHRAWPGHEIQCRARSPRMHALRPTDVITVDAPRLAPARAQGDYVVLSRGTTLSGPTLETSLTLRHLDTF